MDPVSSLKNQENQDPKAGKRPSFLPAGSALLLILLLAFIVFLFRSQQVSPGSNSGDEKSAQQVFRNALSPASDPTPFPFMEMTIPYLRTQTYESTLGELKKHSENASYTSHLTSYKSGDFTVNGLLTQPKGTPPEGGWPAIVFVHGYIPPQNYKTTQNYVSYVDVFAKQGFVVFKIDLRGHDQSEGEPTGAYYAADYIVDVLSARKALQNTSFVNKDRVGLWGHSMAGNILMRSLAVEKDIPAIAIWAGAVYNYDDMQDYGIQDGSYRPPPENSERARRRKELFDTHGEFNSESAFWKQVPATNYLDRIQGTVGLFHAVNDPVVSVEYSRGLKSILDPANIKNELHEYPGGGHNIDGANFTVAMKDTVEFFKKHL